MMSKSTINLLTGILYKEFYEQYGFYMSDKEFAASFPDLSDSAVTEIHKKNCDEIITALSEIREISFEEAKSNLVEFYGF